MVINMTNMISIGVGEYWIENEDLKHNHNFEEAVDLIAIYVKKFLEKQGIEEDNYRYILVKVEEKVKKQILHDIEECMELSQDPFEFRNWKILR